MTTRVTIQISHAHQPVEVKVLSRNAAGQFVPAAMPPTRIEREGDVVTFHVHGNQRLQVVEVEPAAVATPVPPPLPDASADLPDDDAAAADGVDALEEPDRA